MEKMPNYAQFGFRVIKNVECPYCGSKEAYERMAGIVCCCGCSRPVGMWQRNEIKAKVAKFLKGLKPANGFAKYEIDRFKELCCQFGED